MPVLLLALPLATLGCARGAADRPVDAADVPPPDAAADATRAADAPPDAGCAISAGITPSLDGTNDLAEYSSAQHLTPAAPLGSDVGAIAWNPSYLFVTFSSPAFTSPYEPLHVYLEATTSLATAVPAVGKEYSGLTPALPFTPTHLIAVRRVSDAGTGGYNGVFVPASSWMTRTLALDAMVSADQRTVSVSVPWSALGDCPTVLRLAVHVVHAQSGNEWKDLVPSTHTPWLAPGGGFYEIDLTAVPAVTSWTLR